MFAFLVQVKGFEKELRHAMVEDLLRVFPVEQRLGFGPRLFHLLPLHQNKYDSVPVIYEGLTSSAVCDGLLKLLDTHLISPPSGSNPFLTGQSPCKYCWILSRLSFSNGLEGGSRRSLSRSGMLNLRVIAMGLCLRIDKSGFNGWGKCVLCCSVLTRRE